MDALDRFSEEHEAKGVIENRAFANCPVPAVSGKAWLWWRDMTFAARWRGW